MQLVSLELAGNGCSRFESSQTSYYFTLLSRSTAYSYSMPEVTVFCSASKSCGSVERILLQCVYHDGHRGWKCTARLSCMPVLKVEAAAGHPHAEAISVVIATDFLATGIVLNDW